MEPVFFRTAEEFRAWLERNHDRCQELWVGFYRKSTGRPSITWPEAVDQALCFGWIDGIRKRLDDTAYVNRFTPRKRTSNWSSVNIARARELIEAGLMHPAGLAAFESRTPQRSGVYSYEQRHQARLDEEHEARFRAVPAAWAFFERQPPSYRKTAVWWVVSAKKEETRLRRLERLIEDSAEGRRVPPLQPPERNRPPSARHDERADP